MFKTLVALTFVSRAVCAQDAAVPTSPDPVVLEGQRLPMLIGKQPERIVAFAYQEESWRQIPVQIDERAQLPFAQILRRVDRRQTSLFYTDSRTFTGADPDAEFDRDDELVFLIADCCAKAPAGAPDGVQAKSRVELRVKGRPPQNSFVYLFESEGNLDQSAGRNDVRYEFRLDSGDYKKSYKLRAGNNPESSTITTSAYRLGFRDRWIFDELRLTVGDVPGVDILDRHKVQVIPGSCIRTTKTFCRGSGAMIANVDGPVRAIRCVMGANSGPLTERSWICYPRRFDIVTHLRVHALPSTFMYFDYSPDARGMRYHDNNNRGGVVIDGKPDTVEEGRLQWQFLTGRQGSLLIHHSIDTSIEGLKISSLYRDNLRPKWKQCTGDGLALGVSGPLVTKLPNTDPRMRNANTFSSHLVLYPGAAGRKLDDLGKIQAPRTVEVEVRAGG